MIALLISLLIVAAVGYIYIGNRAALRTQTADSRMTDSARIALDFLSRDLRQSAKLGCTRPEAENLFGGIALTATLPFLSAANATQLNEILQQNFTPPVRWIEPGTLIRAFDNGVGYVGPPLSDTSPRRPNTDVVQIIKAAQTGSHLIASMPAFNSNAPLASPLPGAIAAGQQLFVISDCDRTEIVRASVNDAVGAPGGSLSFNAAGWNTNRGLSKPYGVGATVSLFEPVIYMIQNASTNAEVRTPRLVRLGINATGAWNTQPLIIADGIEDLQIRFGVATAGTDGPDRYMTPTEIDAAGAELWRNVRSAEISLVVISEQANTATNATARVNDTGSDTRLRQRIVQTVSLRNAPQ